jgi:hypothetical protein
MLTHRAAIFVRDSQLAGGDFPVNSLFRTATLMRLVAGICVSGRFAVRWSSLEGSISLIFSLLTGGEEFAHDCALRQKFNPLIAA